MRISSKGRLAAAVLTIGLVAAACGGSAEETATEGETATEDGDTGAATGGATLQGVLDRGELICGVNGQLGGFSLNDGGTFSGLDVDYCKAVAAAVLGDADAVEYVELNSEARFPALQSGQVDVLIRNGTWTASRDGALGFTWLATTYYDGQGMLVNSDAGFTEVADMDGATICVQTGTTTELNLETYFTNLGISYEPINVADEAAVTQSFGNGACQAYTTDRSGLASFAADYDGDVAILPDVMSKEPLGPAVREGDDEWADIVQWTVFATFQAEEYELDSSNIGSYSGDNPDIVSFIESSDEVVQLGFPEAGWTVRVIEAVGNYQEIFDRNIVPLGLDEGVNQLWTEGGLLYAPPFR
jgi:general L-amino acid transport system substrate-binding protein